MVIPKKPLRIFQITIGINNKQYCKYNIIKYFKKFIEINVFDKMKIEPDLELSEIQGLSTT